ncbi:MAG TPA: polyphenol oxidase family protein [Gemmatimonadales bacterium]|nr:polyphenol oxidase family protein [Gemmatimonadales bacterium]
MTSVLRESPAIGGPDGIPRLELSEWASRYGLVAGITTAQDGFSLELSSNAPVGPSVDRWRAFQAHFHPRFPAVVFSRQVHGTQVRRYEAVPEGWLIGEGWDGHATTSEGVLLTISVADCIPVYLADPKSGGVALVHAGWRGTVGGILAEGAKALVELTKAPLSNLVSHCGIGICGMCYEVGSEVAHALGGVVPEGTKTRVDLRSHLAEQARALGIRDITISPLCSAHDAGLHSHRASGGKPGRMVAYLGRPKT